MMQTKLAPQQVFMNSARAAPAEAARASPVLQKNIVALPPAASAKLMQPQPAAQQQAASTSEASLDALADRLTSLAVGGNSAAVAYAAPPLSGGNASVDRASARASAAPRGRKAGARDPAAGGLTQAEADRGYLQVEAARVAAREQARAEAAVAKKRRRAEHAQVKRNSAAAAAAALATRLASIHPDEASS